MCGLYIIWSFWRKNDEVIFPQILLYVRFRFPPIYHYKFKNGTCFFVCCIYLSRVERQMQESTGNLLKGKYALEREVQVNSERVVPEWHLFLLRMTWSNFFHIIQFSGRSLSQQSNSPSFECAIVFIY